MLKTTAEFAAFEALDIRVGQITKVEDAQTRKPTYRMTIDFGPEVGTKKSLARLAPLYGTELVGRLVMCVTNFPPRQIGPHQSEVLTLGVPDKDGNTVLLQPERDVPLGGKMY